MGKLQTAVSEPEQTARPHENTKSRRVPRRQPRYNVVLWNDDDHTYGYVIGMMRRLFGLSLEAGMQLATTVDRTGRAVCLTTTKEHAELKRDQIHAFGRDFTIPSCQGSMRASIEPVEEPQQ